MAWFKKKKKKEEEMTQASVTDAPASPEEEQAPLNEQQEAAPEEVIEAPDEKEADPPEERKQEKAKPSGGFFKRLKKGLSKTRDVLTTDIDDLFLGKRKIDDDLLEELEELLITSDMGVQTTMHLMDQIGEKASKIKTADDLKAVLKDEIRLLMDKTPQETAVQASPRIVLVIGVNGVGKTTTIGKLAARFSEDGQKVLLGAADTFRAAAVEQLVIWSERSGVDIVRHRENADPAAVAFDAVEAGVARNKDVVIIDTAGRLHTKVNLMEELKKIKRAVQKKMPDAPHEVLLVLDATTGQNAVSQAKLFDDSIGITGLVLTKLDGTAKGGVVVSICDSLNVPLKYIGVGEGIDDLQKFDSAQFADALFT